MKEFTTTATTTERLAPEAEEIEILPVHNDQVKPDLGINSNFQFHYRKTNESHPCLPSPEGMGGKVGIFKSSIFSCETSTGIFDPPGLPTAGIPKIAHDHSYRFAFYSDSNSTTIHARSFSELPENGQSFGELFPGLSPVTTQSTEGVKRDEWQPISPSIEARNQINTDPGSEYENVQHPFSITVSSHNTWWLDVLNPAEEEMKMFSKMFWIHPLTTEDIITQDPREKVELFPNYYYVCFQSVDTDQNSPTYLEPLNMYIIVFREGILSFHFVPTPHPQNVRRRIKQLKNYVDITSDWISYAIIDDITDAFGPIVQSIEYEVDSIDELSVVVKPQYQGEILQRIGTYRKKVMGLSRLVANKADVVRGLAKRFNEDWLAASPTSDIGLYLADILDLLITMTQNLNHYETILSRSHSNYLAHRSIKMTDANNKMDALLSKVTALGTVLIPMNVITGLWGMNVHVPGQFLPGFGWFFSLLGSIVAWGVIAGILTFKYMVPKQPEL